LKKLQAGYQPMSYYKYFYQVMTVVSRFIIGAIFLVSGIAKVEQPYLFLADIYGMSLLSAKLSMLVVMVVPWFEIACGFCIITTLFESGALLGTAIALLGFVGVHVAIIFKGLNVECGCFGALSREPVSWASALQTFAMLLSVVFYWLLLLASRFQAIPANADITASTLATAQ
jgi:hypothetical protein